MSDEIEGAPGEPATGGLDPLQQTLLEVLLRGGKGGPEALLDLVSQSTLTNDQRAVLHLIRAAQEEWAPDEEPPGSVETQVEPGSGDYGAGTPTDPEEARRELADLREVNDTLAGALGACALCWGGDPNCVVCQGLGGPGFELPDPKLFNQLVVPAVRRAYGYRASGPARTRRATGLTHDRER